MDSDKLRKAGYLTAFLNDPPHKGSVVDGGIQNIPKRLQLRVSRIPNCVYHRHKECRVRPFGKGGISLPRKSRVWSWNERKVSQRLHGLYRIATRVERNGTSQSLDLLLHLECIHCIIVVERGGAVGRFKRVVGKAVTLDSLEGMDRHGVGGGRDGSVAPIVHDAGSFLNGGKGCEDGDSEKEID